RTPPPAARKASARAAASPRDKCGERSPFAMYRCMQQQCALAANRQHAQCVQLRRTDSVE
ncbi:MAG: hypothetical protein H7Z19_23255, partial [Chitinophagaceae bacterium]|nr:hypothetical protein [Rubrivivax sp.]